MTCIGCGETLASDNPRARYCGVNCRAKASKARARGLPAPAPRQLSVVQAAPDDETVVAAAREELRAAGRLDSARGRAVLQLAARIDAGLDTGSALAAALKQFDASLAAATAGAESANLSKLDQMRNRRDQKRHA